MPARSRRPPCCRPNDAAGPRAPSDATPPASSSREGAAPAGYSTWRPPDGGRIDSEQDISGRCLLPGRRRHGDVSHRPSGQPALRARSPKARNIPAFDVEALAILKRASVPPPPEGRRRRVREPQVPCGSYRRQKVEKRLYINLEIRPDADARWLPVERRGNWNARSSDDEQRQEVPGSPVCSDENVPPEELSNLAEQVKGAGFQLYSVTPAPGPDSPMTRVFPRTARVCIRVGRLRRKRGRINRVQRRQRNGRGTRR